VLFLANALLSLRTPAAPANPWNAASLEWSIASPPPQYNFAVIPTVSSRYPLWDQDTLEGDEETARFTHPLAVPHRNMREILNTTEIDAEPQTVSRLPQQSFSPLVLSVTLALCLAGVLADVYWLAGAGLLASLAVALRWAWPNKDFLPIWEQDAL
jgi:hypothetical protein